MHVPWWTRVSAYLWCLTTVLEGAARDFVAWLTRSNPPGPTRAGPPLPGGRSDFYRRRVYGPSADCWNRPIASGPMTSTVVVGATTRECVNLGSYNYLGFGGPDDLCTPEVAREIARAGVAGGPPQASLDADIAAFVGKPDAIVLPMGFSCNSWGIPALVGADCLVLSDQLNHRSLVEGARLSGARIRRFRHNDVRHLEELLVAARGEQWTDVWILAEGVYSMEGDYCPLEEMVDLKRRHGARLYLDEAHSIGAVGATGRGLPERFSVSPDAVDVLAGTFSKSFASVGGYLASDRETIARLRSTHLGAVYGSPLAPGCARQVTAALRVMRSAEGARRLEQLQRNCMTFRAGLRAMGAWVLGADDSPVVPMMLCHPGRMVEFSRGCLQHGLAIVVVGPPATALTLCRARFCVSAAHTARELQIALSVIHRVGHATGVLGIGPRIGRSRQPVALPRPTLEAYPDHQPTQPRGDQLRDARLTDAMPPGALDLRPVDPLALSTHPALVEAAARSLAAFGCGTCGPRGFYGTTDHHLELEAALASFLRAEACCLYSHASTVVSSVVQAYAGPGDLVLADEMLCPMARQAAPLGGATVVDFPHHDHGELDRILTRRRHAGRVFVVVEGLCRATGSIAPVADLLRLRDCHGFYLVLDESLSIGVLGTTGRGACEHHGLEPNTVDLLVGSLEAAVGSIGGFCCGSRRLVEHQRLSASGYCFSASGPRFAVAAARAALALLPSRSAAIRTACEEVHDRVGGALEGTLVRLHGHPWSPVKLVRARADSPDLARAMLERLALAAAALGVGVQPVRHSPLARSPVGTVPSLRLTVRCDMDDEAIDRVARALATAAESVADDFPDLG
jgi:serine palmitoyltransferase